MLFMTYLQKTCVPSETKDENVKLFSIIIRINEVKTLIRHILSNFKCNM